MDLKLGVSYYPENFTEVEWRADLSLMKKTGLAVVRILDFAWTAIEPQEGVYVFAWLDRFLAVAAEHGIQAILCTPTATPPAWLARQYPDVMAMGPDGVRYVWGTRRKVCVNSRVYRHYSQGIAGTLAERYGNHPAVIGWQIDNELIGPEGHAPECHCAECAFLFKQWVKGRYETVTTVNAAWGLRFWNQELSDWGELDTPRNRHCAIGHALEHARFFNEGIVDYIRLQRDALRARITGNQFITHNSTGLFDRCLDHRDFIAELDVGAWDGYLNAAGNHHPLGEAFTGLANDLFRSAKQKPFYMLETNTDDDAYPAYWAEAVARGCGIIMFWHWRRHRSNAENRCPALCDYAGVPYPGRLEKITRFLADIAPRLSMPDAYPQAETVLIYSQEGVRVDHREAARPIPYLDALVRLYQPFWKLGIHLDVVDVGAALSGRKLAIMPCIRLFDDEHAAALISFVREGGILLASAKTAHMDRHGVYHRQLGGSLRALLGIDIAEAELPGVSRVTMTDGTTWTIDGQAEEVRATTAEVLGHFDGNEAKPAVFVNAVGRGKVYYMACVSVQLATDLAQRAMTDAGVRFAGSPDERACSYPDFQGAGRWFFNHTDKPVSFGQTTVPARGFVVPPGDVIHSQDPRRSAAHGAAL